MRDLLTFASELQFATFLKIESSSLHLDVLLTVDDDMTLSLHNVSKIMRQNEASSSSQRVSISSRTLMAKANLISDGFLFEPFTVKTEIITQVSNLLEEPGEA